jgi:hypothetical protein
MQLLPLIPWTVGVAALHVCTGLDGLRQHPPTFMPQRGQITPPRYALSLPYILTKRANRGQLLTMSTCATCLQRLA